MPFNERIDRRSLVGGSLASLATLTLAVPGCGSNGTGGADDGDAAIPPNDAALEDAQADARADAATGCSSSACTANANTLVVSLADHPQLAKPGGSVVLTDKRYTDPNCDQHAVIVAQTSAGKFIAFSASCTHACCTVGFVGTGFSCPCHGSRYDLNGDVTNGPALHALPAVPLCSDACGVYLQLK